MADITNLGASSRIIFDITRDEPIVGDIPNTDTAIEPNRVYPVDVAEPGASSSNNALAFAGGLAARKSAETALDAVHAARTTSAASNARPLLTLVKPTTTAVRAAETAIVTAGENASALQRLLRLLPGSRIQVSGGRVGLGISMVKLLGYGIGGALIFSQKGHNTEGGAIEPLTNSEYSRRVRELARQIFDNNFNVEIVGRENMPTSGPVIIVANHHSDLDPFFLAAYFEDAELGLDRIPRQVAKIQLNQPGLGPFLGANGALFLDRRNPAGWEQQMCPYLDAGECVTFYITGTRVDEGPLARERVKSGGFRLAEQTGSPVVVVTLEGTGKIQDWVQLKGDKPTLKMTVHPQIDPRTMSVDQMIDAAMALINARFEVKP